MYRVIKEEDGHKEIEGQQKMISKKDKNCPLLGKTSNFIFHNCLFQCYFKFENICPKIIQYQLHK